MPYQRFLDTIDAENKDLIDEFFYTFMHFEYALKSVPKYLGGNLDLGDAKAEWDDFSRDVTPIFDKNKSKEIQEATDFLLGNPPKKQINDHRNLRFIPALPPGSDTCKLSIYIRRVRNNLFHGGKFLREDALNRDFELIRFSLIVLKEWAEIIPEVREKFHEPIL